MGEDRERWDDFSDTCEGKCPSTKNASEKGDFEVNDGMKFIWGRILNLKPIKKLLTHLEAEGKVQDKSKLRKYLDLDYIFGKYKAAKHIEGNDGSLALKHAGDLTSYHDNLVSYSHQREEICRFFTSLGHIFGVEKWFTGGMGENVIEAWDIPDFTALEEEYSTVDYSREALRRALEGRTWKEYVDHNNRREGLKTNIVSSTVVKIWGLGGLGKTALVYACLEDLIKDDEWADYEFHRYTIKNEEQGEFTEKGLIAQVDLTVLEWGQTVQNIVENIARRHEDYRGAMINDQLVKLAVDYMKHNNCFVIIDNTEDVEDEETRDELDYKLFENFVKMVARIPKESGSRLVITSRIKKDYDGVNEVKANFLTHTEMKELALLRSDLHYGKGMKGARELRDYVDENEWEDVRKWVKGSLGVRQKEAMGHPHFIILAVYEFNKLEGEKRAELRTFSAFLNELVNDPLVKKLEAYVTNKSVNFIEERFRDIAERMAYQREVFGRDDVKRYLPDDSIGLEDSVIEHLEEDLGLIKKIGVGGVEGDPIRWEWVDYGRKILKKRFYEKNLKDRAKRRAEDRKKMGAGDTAIDQLDELLDKASEMKLKAQNEKSREEMDTVIEEISTKAEEVVNLRKNNQQAGIGQSGERGDRITAVTIGSHRKAEKLLRRMKAKDPNRNLKNLGLLNKATLNIAGESVEGLMNRIKEYSQKKEEGDSEITHHDIMRLCEGYLHHLIRHEWRNQDGMENHSSFDEHIDFIMSEDLHDYFNRSGIIDLLQNVVILRYQMDGRHDSMMTLAMRIERALHTSTKDRIICSIADHRIADFTPEIRQFVSKYLQHHRKRRERLQFSRKNNCLMDILDYSRDDWIENEREVITMAELTRGVSQRKNKIRSFYLRAPPMKGGPIFTTIEEGKKGKSKVLIYGAPAAFKDRGTKTFQILELQHMWTVITGKEREFIQHVLYRDTDHQRTKKIVQDVDVQEEEVVLPTKDDYKWGYKRILENLLAEKAVWLFSAFGAEVNRKCIEEFDLSSAEVRREIGGHGLSAKRAVNKLIGEGKVEFDGNKGYLTVRRLW